MNSSAKMFWQQLLSLLNRQERWKALHVLGLLLMSSWLEVIGIGAVVPFIAVLLHPATMQQHLLFSWVEAFLPKTQIAQITFFAAILVLTFILKNEVLFICVRSQSRYVFSLSARLSNTLLEYYLRLPYARHLLRNTSASLRNINNEVNVLTNQVFVQLFIALTDGAMLFAIFLFLLWFDLVATLVITVAMSLAIWVFMRFTRKKLAQAGAHRQAAADQVNSILLQGLGGIKETKVYHREKYFIKKFSQESHFVADANCYNNYVSTIPKLFVEVVGVAVVLGMMVFLVFAGASSEQILLQLSVFGMAAMKLLPGLNRLVGALTQMRYGQAALKLLSEELSEAKHHAGEKAAEACSDCPPMIFKDNIILDNLSFQYSTARLPALSQISLQIDKGQKVAFVGGSGAGKTTLVDLLLGLLEPCSGKILVDNVPIKSHLKSWQQLLGYIPQIIYLNHMSVKHNVAFGIEASEIDEQQVWYSLEQASMADFVRALPLGIDTPIGEMGMQLSGGQRQRIGIARALYRDPQVLIMDEATAALDNQTEREIVKAIEKLSCDKTIIIIAHRLSTIEHCDKIFFIDKGKITGEGSYQALYEQHEIFRKMVQGERS